MTGCLSPFECRRFDEEGYLSPLDGIEPAEAQSLRHEVEAFADRHGIKEALVLRNKAHLKMPALERVIRDPRILDKVESVLGPDILCWGSSLFIKEPGSPDIVAWHQDAYYWDITPGDVVVAWIAIIESTTENGAMEVVPGSHKEPVQAHRASPDGSANMLFTYEEIAVEVDPATTRACLLKPGQFSLHNMAIVHGSKSNRSDDRRMGLSITYIAPHCRHSGKRTTAMLVRGRNEHGHFGEEPVARGEMDPDVLAFIDRQFGGAMPVRARDSRPPQDFYRAS